MTPPPPSSRFLVLVLSAANFVVGMGAFVVIGILNPVADAFDLSPARAGMLMMIYSVAYALFSPILVSATGRIGRRRVLAFAMGVFGLASLLSALAPTANVLFAARALAAIGAGLVTPVAAAVAAGLTPPERQGAVLANVFLGLSLAQVLGVPLGSYVAYTFGWRSAFLLVTALALPCIVLIWTKVPAGLTFAPVTLSDLGRVMRNARQMLAVSFTAVFIGSTYVIFTFIAPLLNETMGFERNGITTILTVSGLGAVFGSAMGGRLADRIGPVKTLMLLCLSQAAVMPVYSYLPLPVPAVVVLSVVWSTVGWSFMAPQQLRLIVLSRADASVLLALNAGAVYVGAALGSAVGGVILSHHGLLALGLGGAAGAILALVVLLAAERLGPRPAD